MRLSLASAVRPATIALAACGMVLPAFAQDDADQATTEQAAPPAPTVVRFDPGRMPEAELNTPALGWRYGSLSSGQKRALRRGFKLPLDALAAAKSPRDLVRAAVIAPLPDPSQPMLPVKAVEAGASDPFADGKKKRTAFRDDPMRALGEWLGVTDEDATGDAFAGSSDPFADGVDGGFDTDSATASPADTEDDTDPFAGDSGAEDDPFADF
ncbi:hypothetical protein MalM25_00550 [Planctomycetes bacterium MalM25]|nr:hypothetical protein MalM25_00550 [Planctomycetes bacterium MalM25]